MATVICIISVIVLCVLIKDALIDFFCTIIGVLFFIAIFCIIGGALGWLVFFLFTSSIAAAVPGFVLGCVGGLICFFVKKAH